MIVGLLVSLDSERQASSRRQAPKAKVGWLRVTWNQSQYAVVRSWIGDWTKSLGPFRTDDDEPWVIPNSSSVSHDNQSDHANIQNRQSRAGDDKQRFLWAEGSDLIIANKHGTCFSIVDRAMGIAVHRIEVDQRLVLEKIEGYIKHIREDGKVHRFRSEKWPANRDASSPSILDYLAIKTVARLESPLRTDSELFLE